MIYRIVSLLKKNKQGLGFAKIATKLHLSSKEKTSLKKQLKKLEDQGAVIQLRKKYFLCPQASILRGKWISSLPGFGFVRPDEGYGEDIFIPARYAGEALLGDSVEVSVKERGRKGKPEGRVLRILKKKKKHLLGLYRERAGLSFVRPFETHLVEDVPVKGVSGLRIEEGVVVSVDRDTLVLGEVLGRPDDPGVDTQVVIRSHDLRASFRPEALAESEKIPLRIPGSALKERTDYRDWPTFTIDGETAQDFDDAVSVRKKSGGNVLLGVHIADVSHYVQPGSALDAEALDRGTSVYFPGLTLPMFPEIIANHICSLRPREDKLTVSVVLEFDGDGNTVQADFFPSVIHTQERMTYTSVFKIFEGNKKERQKFKSLVPDLLLMKDLALSLRRRRLRSGSLDFDLAEPELVYEGETLLSVLPADRNLAHQVIEEFMVAANEAVAGFLNERVGALIFRVHPAPSLESLTKLREILEHLGFSLPSANKIKSKDLQRVLEQIAGKPEEKFLNLQILKSMSQALYAEENEGHYGLSKKLYTHFTSPIRRYPDLVVHRILKSVLEPGGQIPSSLDSLARHCSQRERNADEAEKDLIEWRIFRFLKKKLGDEMEGIVVNVSKAGMFVELDNYFVDGLVPIDDLGSDFYVRRKEKQIVGRRTGKTFSLGNRVRVILAAVDPLLRRINLALVN